MKRDAGIVIAGGDQIEAVAALWNEYWTSLGLTRDFQNFAHELKTLPGVYALPKGRLLLASIQNNPAGTVALRPLDEQRCEVKRLYVRPQYRGQGLGRTLLDQLIKDARSIGYAEIFCDTLESMNTARSLYAEMGFKEVSAYSSNPTPDGIFFSLSLI